MLKTGTNKVKDQILCCNTVLQLLMQPGRVSHQDLPRLYYKTQQIHRAQIKPSVK